jgi:hypothetical protein
MGKCSVLVVSLLSLFLLFSFRGYADLIFYNDTANPSGTVYYVPNQNYNFSIILQNTSFPLSTVLFEWNGINEIATRNVSIEDANTTQFFVDKVDLPANETGWSYRWFASDTNNTSNYSNLQSYIINKSSTTINLFLDNNESNKTYNLNYQNANFTSLLNISGKNITLASNMTGFPVNSSTSTITKIINLTNSGLFYLNASFSGDQNYSSNFVNYYFYVKPWSINIASPSSPVTYQQGRNYQFNVTWQNKTPINNVYFVWNGINVTPTGNRTIDANTTEFYLNKTDLPANPTGYAYNLNVNDTNGSIVSSDQWNYVINQIPITLSWTNPSSSPPWMVTAGTAGTIVRCLASDSSINLTLTVSSGSVSSNINLIGSVSDSPSSSTAATYLYSCYPTDGNYSGGPIQATLYFQSSGVNTNSGTGTGTDTGTSTGSFIIYGLTPTLSINPGESKQVSFTLKNTLGKGAIANVTISVTGIDSSWYTPLSKINYSYNNVLQTLTLTFKIPSDAGANDYTVKIVATGKLVLNSSTISTPDATMKLTVASPQPIPPMPSETVSPQETAQQNETANITSNQTSVVTGLAPAFEFFKSNLVIILAVAACLLIFIFRNNITTALGGTLGNEEAEKTHKAKSTSPLKGIKDKLNYKLIVNLKKESKAKSLKEPTEVQDTEKVPEAISEKVPEKETKRPAILEKEIKRDIKELQSIIENEKKVGKNKKKFSLGNN